ncbi:MAG: hypothetical protein JSS28_08625, partial [Proteobacteria bacterium]|nr:hypothetical protein [Pseudomonadota bacterium]
MPLAKTPRPAFPAGRFALLMLLLASAACFAVAVDPDDLIQRADQIKTASNAQFQDLLAQLNGQAGQLTALQHDWLDYLNAWQLLYRGNFKEGTNALDALLTHSRDPVLRARTHISLLSAETNAAHYEEAYANLSDLLASLPKVEDRTVRALSLDVAAQLYNQAGQYELALNFADEALASNSNAHLSCYATTLKAESLYHIRKLHADDAPIRAGIDACQKSGEILAASLIRLWMAKAQFDAGDVRSALADLEAHDALVRSTNSSSSISLYHAIMAQAYLATGDLVHATQYAHSAVDHANKQEFAPSVADAYQVLYQVAKRQGDDKAALDWYEKYAAADKGYINALSARSLAYQKVHQRV